MGKIKRDPQQLTDEEVLSEFVSRFKCDAALLIYRDGDVENCFWKWVNKDGELWSKNIQNTLRNRDKI